MSATGIAYETTTTLTYTDCFRRCAAQRFPLVFCAHDAFSLRLRHYERRRDENRHLLSAIRSPGDSAPGPDHRTSGSRLSSNLWGRAILMALRLTWTGGVQ